MLAMLGAKLGLFVLVPLALFHVSGKYKISELMPASSVPTHLRVALWKSLVLILFQTVFGRGVSEIRHSGLPSWAVAVGIPSAHIWLLLELGLVEEFFFRVLLQSRLQRIVRSEPAGIVLIALLFGLAHAPGLHFRSAVTLEGLGPHPSWLIAVDLGVQNSFFIFFIGLPAHSGKVQRLLANDDPNKVTGITVTLLRRLHAADDVLW